MKFKLRSGYGRSDVGSIVLDPKESPEYETWDADEIVNLRATPFVDEVEEPAKDVIASLPDLELRAVKNVRSFDGRPSVAAAAEAEIATRHDATLAQQAAIAVEEEPERLVREEEELLARLAQLQERRAEIQAAADEEADD